MTQPINTLPAIALRGTTILPEMIVHFDISRERSIKAVEAAMLRGQEIFLVTQKDPEIENPGISDLCRVGTIAYIKQVVKLPHDLLRVLVEGRERAELLSLVQEETFLEAEISGSTSGRGSICRHCAGGYVQRNSWSVSSVLYGKRQGQPGAGSPDHEYRKP